MAEEQAEYRSVPVVWVGLDEAPTYFANQFLCQFQEGEFTLSVGSMAPPAILGSPEERAEQIKRLNFVSVKPITRLGMTPERMRQLINVLQENLASYEEARSERRSGGGDQ